MAKNQLDVKVILGKGKVYIDSFGCVFGMLPSDLTGSLDDFYFSGFWRGDGRNSGFR